nr:hypothetical protein [Streptomyces sp. SID5468]
MDPRAGGGTGAGSPDGDRLGVEPSVLRASAAAAGTVAGDLAQAVTPALRDVRAAAASLAGWGSGARLEADAAGWTAAFEGLHRRIGRIGALLTDTANGHEWHDDRVYQAFSGDLKR